MNNPLLYLAVKSKFLECRRAANEDRMTPDEAGDEYARLGDELAELHGHDAAEQAMNDFAADLSLLNAMEKLDPLGPIAMVIGYVSAFFVDEQQIDRVLRLNDELTALDAEYAETKPGDQS